MSPVMEIEPVKEVVLVTAAWGALYYLFMQMGPAPCAANPAASLLHCAFMRVPMTRTAVLLPRSRLIYWSLRQPAGWGLQRQTDPNG